ncbi:hypothetical protein BT96DRAFT_984306 [Gymnopus androsaceus JB14]|uniref:Uncharacterized protein n=1 Tax=Gymnopus androsaceus JB14 TaxID=1447944 RepID=A0A6A4IJ56_9AGAR|nr:hypothetical protein BT96DRAFT_984306 [Gymnopus androsaceus JB14]
MKCIYISIGIRLASYLEKYTGGAHTETIQSHSRQAYTMGSRSRLTKPQNWSPNATRAATRTFISIMKPPQAQLFLSVVLLDDVQEDIQTCICSTVRYASGLTSDQKDASLGATPHAQISPEFRRELVDSILFLAIKQAYRCSEGLGLSSSEAKIRAKVRAAGAEECGRLGANHLGSACVGEEVGEGEFGQEGEWVGKDE